MYIEIFRGLSAGFAGYHLGGAGPRRRSPGARRRTAEHQERTGNGSSRTGPDKRMRIPPVGEHPRLTRKGCRKSAGADQGQGKESDPTCCPPSCGSGGPLSSFRVGWETCSSRYGSIGDQPPSEYPSPADTITSSIRVVTIKSPYKLVSSLHRRLKVAED